MRRFSDDDKEADLCLYYCFLLIGLVPYVSISLYGKPAPIANFNQPFFVRSVVPEEVGMLSHLQAGIFKNFRKRAAKIPIREKYHTYAALSKIAACLTSSSVRL